MKVMFFVLYYVAYNGAMVPAPVPPATSRVLERQECKDRAFMINAELSVDHDNMASVRAVCLPVVWNAE